MSLPRRQLVWVMVLLNATITLGELGAVDPTATDNPQVVVLDEPVPAPGQDVWSDASSDSGATYSGAWAHHHDAGQGLYFAHPILAEPPTPETKARIDYQVEHDNDLNEQAVALELEYALTRWFGVEAHIPLIHADPADGPSETSLGNMEIALELAGFWFERYGVVIGGGIELGLPTGDDAKGIGSNNELEIEPFVNAGVKFDRFELVGGISFGIPVNEDDGQEDEVDLEVGYNVALTCHINAHVDALLELQGETVASGHENESVLNIAPGVIVRPFADSDLAIGAAVAWPVTRDKSYDFKTILSLFYHF